MPAALMWVTLHRSVLMLDMKYTDTIGRVKETTCSSAVIVTEGEV